MNKGLNKLHNDQISNILLHTILKITEINIKLLTYEGWNFNSGNYLFTTDTKQIHVSKFYCPSM